jgi:hypothetical protein
VTDTADPLDIAILMAGHLETLGIPYTVGGSIAASFAGEPRSTLDIDMVVAIEERHVDDLIALLERDFYVDAGAVRRAIRSRSSANAVHQATQLKVDLFIAGGTPFDEQQLARRLDVDLGDGRHLYVHPPEDILLQKLRWYQLGGEISDRQWRDIVGIVRVQGARLDREYLVRTASAAGLSNLMERALSER